MDIMSFLNALQNQPIGTVDQPYNPAARLAMGQPSYGMRMGMGASGGVRAPANPTQFGSAPGLPTSLTSAPGAGAGGGGGAPQSLLGNLGMAIAPQTMSATGKGGASG